MTFDDNYIKLLKDILENGRWEETRTGEPCKSVFTRILDAGEMRWGSIPISNLRKIYYKGALIETLWFLGLHAKDEKYKKLPITNVKYLHDNGVHYWDKWIDEDGNLGPVYGEQLTRWKRQSLVEDPMDGETSVRFEFINQIQYIIDTLRKNPNDRRLITNLWNPAEIDKMALPPCHYGMQFNSREVSDGSGGVKRKLDLTWIQRSCDFPIGIPYNVIQYAIIQKIVAACTNHEPGRLQAMLGNCHVYRNQLPMVDEMIRRYDRGDLEKCSTPSIKLGESIKNAAIARLGERGGVMLDLDDFSIDGSDFVLDNYKPLPAINIPVAK